MADEEITLKDVLLYLARNVPVTPADLAVMERVIEEAFAQPAPPAAEQPGT